MHGFHLDENKTDLERCLRNIRNRLILQFIPHCCNFLSWKEREAHAQLHPDMESIIFTEWYLEAVLHHVFEHILGKMEPTTPDFRIRKDCL